MRVHTMFDTTGCEMLLKQNQMSLKRRMEKINIERRIRNILPAAVNRTNRYRQP